MAAPPLRPACSPPAAVRPPSALAGPAGSVVQWLAVAAALVFFFGTLWVVYSEGGRGRSEAEVVLIRAPETPARVRPADPGGMEIPMEDALVFDLIDPAREVEATERLLPPPEPVLPRPELPAPRPPPAAADPSSAAPDDIATLLPPAAAAPPLSPLLPASPSSPEASAAAAPAPADPAVAAVPPALGPGGLPVIPIPRPQAPPRPAETAQAPDPQAPVAASGRGSWRIQLGSLPSQAEAEAEWQRLARRYPQVLAALTPVLERAEIEGKGVFFRVQAGSLDEAGARAACDQLKAAEWPWCLPVAR